MLSLRSIKNFSPAFIKLFTHFYFLPYVGAGIKLSKLSPDFKEAETKMKLRWYNKNMVGSHFGGSLYSMTDPIYMLMLGAHIGDTHYVWDKSASIEYVKPSKSEVRAHFQISTVEVNSIVEQASDGEPHYFTFDVDVMDTDNEVIARIKKTLYVRKKKQEKLT